VREPYLIAKRSNRIMAYGGLVALVGVIVDSRWLTVVGFVGNVIAAVVGWVAMREAQRGCDRRIAALLADPSSLRRVPKERQ
jgi:hypothetical protein